MIRCRVCNAKRRSLASAHLKFHGMSSKQYQKKFPGAPLRSRSMQERVSLGLSKSEKFKEAQSTRSKNYWASLTKKERHAAAKSRWTPEAKKERSKKYTGKGNPMYGKERPDFNKNRFQPPKGWRSGDDNVAKRPEVRAKMRKPHKMTIEGSKILAINGRKNLRRAWKEQRDVMLEGVRANLHDTYTTLRRKGSGFPVGHVHYTSPIAGEMLLMSQMEKRWAKILDGFGWKWEYNDFKFSIPYKFKGKKHNYFPDFIVKAPNFELVEVKGRMMERDVYKIRATEKAGYRILLVTGLTLNLYEKETKRRGLYLVA